MTADRPQPKRGHTAGRSVGLVIGDILIFLVFALAGRSAHEGSTSLGELVHIAAPFSIAWLVVAPWMGLYRPEIANAWKPTVQATAIAWGIAGPLGLVLRRFMFNRAIPTPFIITTLLINLGLLLAWRVWTARKFEKIEALAQ